ncbi:hypothetical protein HS088_TW17G00248 [Tripterygium wilfordii]|uniref:Uncharacterized protein n=1 Tax=Tripterygium wilfordii TaxID=458696 RepID=A0A7J7CF02_TRIWF|nr:hypothetical protein HS088_TW17G00248 [Tripterygium wilfordii]
MHAWSLLRYMHLFETNDVLCLFFFLVVFVHIFVWLRLLSLMYRYSFLLPLLNFVYIGYFKRDTRNALFSILQDHFSRFLISKYRRCCSHVVWLIWSSGNSDSCYHWVLIDSDLIFPSLIPC